MEKFKGIIYKVENMENGKVYVGATTLKLEKRRQLHESAVKQDRNDCGLYTALRDEGFDKFEWTIIDNASNNKEMMEKEIYWIQHFRDSEQGVYNITNGGSGVSGYKHTDEFKRRLSAKRKGSGNPNAKLTADDVRQIRMLGDSMMNDELADLFDVTASNISRILRGKSWENLELDVV